MSSGSERPTGDAASYDALAGRYDELFPQQLALWRRARKDLLRRVPYGVASLCDLACGTGVVALEFARRGAIVFALDLSAAMCAEVRRKARREALAVRVICADMRSFRLPKQVDLVTCSFHALNHLLTERDFRSTLRRVHDVLRPGGFFLFDCGHAPMYEAASAENSCFDAGSLFVVKGYEFDAQRGKAWFEATWFVRRGTRWQRFDESIPQVPWPDRKVRAMLPREGFELKVASDGTHFLNRPDSKMRGFVTFYLARKK